MSKPASPPRPKPGAPTQHFLDIREIRDDVVVMKDGSVRAVLLISSINFALKSSEEQEAIIQAYMSFLNGLEFPIQIVIQSRRMNIDAYLASLGAYETKTTNDLLKNQIRDYRQFVQELVELGEIMQKRFYIILTYDPFEDKKRKNFWTRLQSSLSPVVGIRLKEKQFMDRRESILKRVPVVQSQLSSMNLVSTLLDTQSLIELYYSTYNPDLFKNQKLSDLSQVRYENAS